MTNPTACDDTSVDSVKTNDVGSTEESICKKPDYAGESVLSEDIQAVIDAEPVLDCELLELGSDEQSVVLNSLFVA